jgi:hypothetical protein
MWLWVWAALILSALAGAAVVGRDLWRAGVRVVREVSRAGSTLSSGTERVSLAVAEAEARRVDTSPTLFDDETQLRERVRERRLARAGRRALRYERHRATWQVWASAPWLERRQAERRRQAR